MMPVSTMKINQLARNLFFKIRYGFRGFPLSVNGDSLRVVEDLRRWNINSELAALSSFKDYLRSDDIMIDIGANFGLHALYGAKLVGEQGHVYAFEPVASNLDLLKRNIILNNFEKQITIVPKAVSNSRQKFLSFYVPSQEMTVTASLGKTEDNSLEIKVENTRLEDYWETIGLPVKLIKIDVEGAELEVLRGAERILKQWHPILMVEVHGFALPEFGASVEDLRAYLKNFGYQEHKLEYNQFYRDDYFQAVYVTQST